MCILSDCAVRIETGSTRCSFKVQKMAQYASFCLIMGPLKGEVPVFARLWPVRPPWRAETPTHSRGPGNIRVRVRVSFTTGAVRSAILATAGLLVFLSYGPGFTSMQHTTSHTTTVQPPPHFEWYILVGKQWYQLPEFILPNSNSVLHSFISISIHTEHAT